MRLEAVIFDLDDTLIDWWGSIERCLSEFAGDGVIRSLQEHCRAACWEFRPGSQDVWHRNTWALHHHRHEHWPVALGHLDPGERQLLLKRFEAELWVGFFPDTVPTLDALVGQCRLAVLSNNQHLADEVERLRLGGWFELAVAAPPDRQKPHPGAFTAVADALGLAPAHCAYVGDSVRADVIGALGAGMVPIWLNRWGDAWPDRPVEVIPMASLAELPAVVAARQAT